MGALWAIVGATGTGKSESALDLAERLGAARGVPAQIVNSDAMQLYAGMDIGTAKLPASERRGIPHHMFDVFEPREEATVARYQPDARAAISAILKQGGDAILVGGSGLYVSSVVFDFQFPPRDAATRAALEREYESAGIEPLVARLSDLDPAVAAAVDRRNPRRVIRALEVALLGGDAMVTLPSDPVLWHAGAGHDRTHILGIACERGVLTERLDARVRGMWASGMLDEVRGLLPQGLAEGKTASRAIGYAQALAQLAGDLTEGEAIAETQALTRRYARRQVSWFKRYPNAAWIDQTAGRDLSALDEIVSGSLRAE